MIWIKPTMDILQWIGLRDNLHENLMMLMGKSMVSGWDFPLNQSIEWELGIFHGD